MSATKQAAAAVFDAMRVLKPGDLCECGHGGTAHYETAHKVPELPFKWTCMVLECDCLRPGPTRA